MKTLHYSIIAILTIMISSVTICYANVDNQDPEINMLSHESPLKQFKSGVAANDIICRPDMQLLIQNQENFPICVKLNSVSNLLRQDWSYPTNCKYIHDPVTIGVAGLVIIEKNASDPSSGKSYSPRNSTIVIGWNNTVSWINQDVAPSGVTSDWNLFDSGSILPGNDWKHDFECAGNYGYHSEPHPWMKGWIRVLPPINNMEHLLPVQPESQNPFMADKDGKVDLSQIHLPSNNYGQIDYDKIGYLVSEDKFKKMLEQLDIKYADNNFLLLTGESLLSYPPFTSYCGYVMDDNKEEHWFSSSFHRDTLTSYKISRYNPEPCKPGFASCFCNLQTKIAENNLKQMSYFSKSEEETVGETMVQYLDKTKVVNVSNDFSVGKYNLQTDPSLVHYCGKFTWGEQLQYFEGYMKDSNVVFFELAPEQQKLCAINADAKIFSFEYKENGFGK